MKSWLQSISLNKISKRTKVIMNFLFSHRNFPAQFRHILLELAKDPDNKKVFLTNTINNLQIKNVQKVYYTTKREVPKNCHRYLRQYEESVIHGQAACETLIQLKNQGFRPDVIYAHMLSLIHISEPTRHWEM